MLCYCFLGRRRCLRFCFCGAVGCAKFRLVWTVVGLYTIFSNVVRKFPKLYFPVPEPCTRAPLFAVFAAGDAIRIVALEYRTPGHLPRGGSRNRIWTRGRIFVNFRLYIGCSLEDAFRQHCSLTSGKLPSNLGTLADMIILKVLGLAVLFVRLLVEDFVAERFSIVVVGDSGQPLNTLRSPQSDGTDVLSDIWVRFESVVQVHFAHGVANEDRLCTHAGGAGRFE